MAVSSYNGSHFQAEHQSPKSFDGRGKEADSDDDSDITMQF